MTPNRVAAALLALAAPVLATSVLGAPAALAQGAQPPAQIANHANGLSYQPTLGGVETREQSAGVKPTGRQLSTEDRELDQINRQLLGPDAKPPVQAPGR